MEPLSIFSYAFRKYPLFRTLVWLLLIMIVFGSAAVINMHFVSEPLLKSVNPSIGSPGDVLVLKGDHFGSTRNTGFVEIGGERLTASSYLSWADDEIKLVLPSNVQEGLVIVDVSGKRSNPGVFTNETTVPVTVRSDQISKIPVIIGLSHGTAATGQKISITGANFGDIRGDSCVFFKTSRSSSLPSDSNLSLNTADMLPANQDDYDYEFWSDTEISVRVPDGAISGNVTVKTPEGLSRPQPITIANRGKKTFSNGKTYLVQVSADIANVKATSNSSLTLHIPRPNILSSQPAVEMTECNPQPLLDNYRNTVIHQVEFKELKDNKKQFTQNFMVQVYEISCEINKDQVRPFSDKERPLYAGNIKANPYVPSDSDAVKELGLYVVKKESNPYVQARLVYDYLIENFTLSDVASSKDFALETILQQKQADAYDLTVLFTAMLRSLGVPAKMMSGILVDARLKTQNHWWSEFYIENFGWVPVDPGLGAGMGYEAFHPVENKKEYYFGNLDSQHIVFSTGWEILKPYMVNNKIVYRPRSYALQNIWEEASAGTDSYSSFWNVPVVLGLY
ncbi:IPT/TIG domain-containing protein [Treponema parvum]|uniref:IPT/TIG domain-containing protein n=1 Tax=Treponema parvum TaxID=138851 RepID=A0A975IF32_9SPIR|nr:transglutaminase domain-containing protein [Treponema parvum]QTQ14566.1 IPT/TIG domain-containing protein [Treponema parvum]